MRFFAPAVLVSALACSVLSAQARPAAQQPIRLQVYALGAYVQPDFGGSRRNAGATVGLNILAHRYFGLLDPSLDLRALGSGGRVSNQYVLGFAPRVAFDLPYVQPYVEYLIADGIIHFHGSTDPNYTSDNSLVTGPAVGADVPLNSSWSLRVEATRQHWQLSHLTPPFHPVSVGIGVRYQFHLHTRFGPD